MVIKPKNMMGNEEMKERNRPGSMKNCMETSKLKINLKFLSACGSQLLRFLCTGLTSGYVLGCSWHRLSRQQLHFSNLPKILQHLPSLRPHCLPGRGAHQTRVRAYPETRDDPASQGPETDAPGVEGHSDEDHVDGHQTKTARFIFGHHQRGVLHDCRQYV